MALLELTGIHKSFPGLSVLRGLDLTLDRGEVLAVQGASGTGKSTLLNIIGLLDRPDQGRIVLADQVIDGMSHDRRSRMRARTLGFVFQGFHLLPEFDALENVLMPARCAGLPIAPARERARELLTAVGLAARAAADVGVLSGGERQRVAICRALVLRPALILADEPTGNLDPATAAVVLDQILGLARDQGSSVILVTHDPAIACRAGRRATLSGGILHHEPRSSILDQSS